MFKLPATTSLPRQLCGLCGKTRAPLDVLGGLTVLCVSLFALWASRDLGGWNGVGFGPGTAPRLAAGLLAVASIFLIARGFFIDGPQLEGFAVRGAAYVIGSIALFALMLKGFHVELFGSRIGTPPLGIVISTFMTFLIAMRGSSEFQLKEGAAAAVVMTVLSVLLFVYLLEMPIELWPEFN